MPDSPRNIFANQGGMDTVNSPDLISEGCYAYLQNTRKLLGGRVVARPPLGANLLASPLAGTIRSLTRMKDPYMGAPGYVFIESTNGDLYLNTTKVASGLSGKPVSFLPYRPPASPQPWCYVADEDLAISILSPSYAGYAGPLCGMVKLRSDATCYKTGVMEPQAAPTVSTSATTGPNSIVYRYRYRSSITGAVSNPSPESTPVLVGELYTDQTAYPINSAQWRINLSQWEYMLTQWRTVGGIATHITLDPTYCQGMNFASTLPTGVTITGVEVTLEWLNEPGARPGTLLNIGLSYQGNLLGVQKFPNLQSSPSITDSVFGSFGDTWGATLTPGIITDPTFGVGFQIYVDNARMFIDFVRIRVYYAVQNQTVTPSPSTDPQVDTIDIYRMGGALENFTYVGSTTNSATPFTDTLSDLVAALNPVLEFDNYEPFPSIDLPRAGVVNVGANGVLTWVSGATFNTRWLPGTIVLVGGVAYVLYNRPPNSTHMTVYTTTVSSGTITFGYPPVAANVPWQIAEPILAAEPSPVIWGPTPDNAGSFYFGLDPNNPGDLLWSKGNNFDSAPETNRMQVTSPSEPLMNGTVTSELSTVFSTERFWLIYPNFSDAVATVTGTLGQQWALVQSVATRGLYMRYAIASLGSLIAWRAKDGIYISQGGGPEQEISTLIYNLFPHGEPSITSPVSVGGNTVYPPDDTKPDAQVISLVPGYLYYDYQDSNGTPRTLVYDMEAKGWSVDLTAPVANCHALPVADNQILLGCVDGTIRSFDNAGTEVGTAIVASPSQNGGSPRTVKRLGGVFVRALAATAITPQFWKNRYSSQVTGFSPATIGTAAGEADYLTDFTGATGADVLDLGCVFSFALGSGDWLKEWQTDWTEIPEQIVAWRTGMLAYGLDGWMHIPWLRFAYQSTTDVTLSLITDQGATATITVPSSSGVPAKFFSWVPAMSQGISMKFKLLEWVADAGGTPLTVFGKDCEVAIKSWGSPDAYQILRPFRSQDGSST